MTGSQRKDTRIDFEVNPEFGFDGNMQPYIYLRKFAHKNLLTDTTKTLYERCDPGVFLHAEDSERRLALELGSE
jgi:hypothetical protein